MYMSSKTLLKINNDVIVDVFKRNNRVMCLLSSGKCLYFKDESPMAHCDCGNTYKIKNSTIFLNFFNEKKYVCKRCSSLGKNNPFYGHIHTDEFKKRLSKDRKGNWGIGEKNGMFNKSNYEIWTKKYGKSTADLKQKESIEKNRIANSGCKNGFYGKKHSSELILKIKKSNRLYREKNKENLTKIGMEKLKLTDDILKNILKDYSVNPNNRSSIKNKYGLDFRTVESYLIKRNIVTKEELKEIKRRKKFLGNRDLTKLVSKPEFELYEKLTEIYGKQNIKSCFIIPNTSVVYDICLFDKILIEYDGYYWHKIKKSKNDLYKSDLAKIKGYMLYRVEENEKRKIDFTKELSMIDSIVKNNTL